MRSLRPMWAVPFFLALFAASLPAQTPSPAQNTMTWALRYDPKTLDPAKVDDQSSEMIRYLTAGVLVRLNRHTLSLEPMLADRWTWGLNGKLLTLHMRPNLHFSDGSPLTSADVVASLQRVLAPATASPVAEEFIEPARVNVTAPDASTVLVHLPVPVANLGSALDEIAIEPAHRISEAAVTAGPYTVVEYKRGEYLRLHKNPYFWKHDSHGASLPFIAEIQLDILANRETEELRFLQGRYAALDHVPTEGFDALSRRLPGAVHDLGPSLNTEQMWFNQAPGAPIPDYEKRWFADVTFRRAISNALHRADLAKIAFDGHATPANGFISPVNTSWYNRALPPVHDDPQAALAQLQKAGFRNQGNQLLDAQGHPVRFSLLTNAGNRSREKMAALIQQDLSALGIQVNVVTLDFPALIERLMHTSDYEAALLGLSNVQPDPSSMMNLWLSSSPNHQWNPGEKKPATPWEAEIDEKMRLQAVSADPHVRKAAIDRVQAIVAEQLPFLYLVYPNTLCAVSPQMEDAELSILQPDVASSIETMHWKGDRR